MFTCYPHALFNGFSLQKACRFLLLLLYVSVWNSGVCYVGQCGEKWQVFQVNRVAPCTKSLSSRSIYPSFQNESTFTFNFHFKIPDILDISIMIDFELNLFFDVFIDLGSLILYFFLNFYYFFLVCLLERTYGEGYISMFLKEGIGVRNKDFLSFWMCHKKYIWW